MAWNIADLTEHVVDSVPDRIALIIADEPRTYAQLEERANRLAHHLAAQGIGPGDHVGIYGFNSHAFVETILGASRSGAGSPSIPRQPPPIWSTRDSSCRTGRVPTVSTPSPSCS